MRKFNVNICAQHLNGEVGPRARVSSKCLSSHFLIRYDLYVWGILWNSADKMANSKIYLISEGNPHRFVHLRIHGHLAVLLFFNAEGKNIAFREEKLFKNE